MQITLNDLTFSITTPDIVLLLLSIIFGIWGVYNKIKFICLEKASEMVAKTEGYEDLSGQEKFAICVLWINESLPSIFKNIIFKYIIQKTINFAYENSFIYANNYIKRKTGQDVSSLMSQIKPEENKKDAVESIDYGSIFEPILTDNDKIEEPSIDENKIDEIINTLKEEKKEETKSKLLLLKKSSE